MKFFTLMLGSTLESVLATMSSVGGVNEINGTIIDDKSNKMIMNGDMFCLSVIRPVTGEHHGSLCI